MGRYLHHEKGEWAVDRARYELQRMGYSVAPPEHACKHGPDLVAWIGSKKEFHVEVKLARWNKGAWMINRVTRKMDHVIAIVFPSGRVCFESMKDHLKLCNKSGDRYISALGEIFNA